MMLQRKVDGSNEGPDLTLRFHVRSLLYFSSFFRFSNEDNFQILFICYGQLFRLSIFLMSSSCAISNDFFKDKLLTMSGYANFSIDSSLEITLLLQVYYFMSAKLCYRWHFLWFQLNKCDQMKYLCNKRLQTKCLKINFKIGSVLSCLELDAFSMIHRSVLMTFSMKSIVSYSSRGKH